MIWHSSHIDDVLKQFNVNPDTGLTNSVVEDKIETYGKNEIKSAEKLTLFERFLQQLKSKTLISLIIVSFISFIIALVYKQPNPHTNLMLILVLLVTAFINAFYLYTCDNTFNDIKSVAHPKVKVLRDGTVKVITSDYLVTGDIILLSEGDFVSADARLIESVELRLNESALTGEEVPVEKEASVILDDIIPFENRSNMVFSGTTVVHGTAKAVVVAVGYETENGKTSYIQQQIGEKQMPIENEIDLVGKFVNGTVLVVCILTFIITLFQNISSELPFAITTLSLILNSLALAVAAIPKGLPAIATIVIATGLGRFLKEKIILKRINVFEMVGKTDVILADKTGLLTHKDMTLSKIYDGKRVMELGTDTLSDNAYILLKLGAVCSTLTNDSTEKTIKNACYEYNRISETDLLAMMPKLNTIPFDSTRKSMTVITMIHERPFAIVKGAPEIIIPKCNNCNTNQILAVNEELAQSGFRNICVAMRPLSAIPTNPNAESIENNLTFVGIFALKENVRKSAIKDIRLCNKANIKTIMVTGDNLSTAKVIAYQLGILTDESQAITGEELKYMTDEQLSLNIENYRVFARVTPADKLRIVKAWQRRKAIVTITGDRLKDAEALACADIGCAIGQYGTDVAKGNADIIILKNGFSSLVTTIKESRGFFSNIKKAVYYLCSCNLSELLLVFLSSCIFKIPALAAVQLLLVNLLTDSAPAISYSLEKAEDAVMNKKTFNKLRRLIDAKFFASVVLQSIVMATCSLFAFGIGNKVSHEVGMTMAFVTIGLSQGIHCFNNKFEGTIFTKELFSNSFMNKSVFCELFIVIFLAFTPIGFMFGFTILTLPQFLISLLLAIIILPICELFKFIKLKV